jgi:hypothetical protein
MPVAPQVRGSGWYHDDVSDARLDGEFTAGASVLLAGLIRLHCRDELGLGIAGRVGHALSQIEPRGRNR